MVVDWATRRAQVVCYQCGKRGHYISECKEGQRIRILKIGEEN